MVTPQHLNDINIALETHQPGRWRRLSSDKLKSKVPFDFYAGWHISVPDGAVHAPGVRYIVLGIDRSFPNSQPRTLAPELGSLFKWPHVEPDGLLCLAPTSIEASTRDRVRLLLDHTFRLLNLSDEQCQAEFRREFGSYWSQLATRGQDKLRVLSLLKSSGRSREVIFHFAARQRRIIVADDFPTLSAWLHNVGEVITPRQVQPSVLLRLEHPWLPEEFPTTVAQSIDSLPNELVRPILIQHPWSLLVFEALTDTGPVFAAVLINSNKLSKLKNGFRSLKQVPLEHIKRALASQRVERVVVSRLDPAWVHGRGHSADLKSLQTSRVGIIGCGSIGSEIAALLAKAGVGELMLLDHDTLNSANLGRHFLGTIHLGHNKAQALAHELCHRLPHLRIKYAYPTKFEWLSAAELNKLADMDLIVTAGLDIEGEAAVNAWRHTLDRPPAYVSTWVEAFCTAGHAVLLYGHDDLMAQFEQERPTFRLTDWAQESNHLLIEAGCGNVFQPYGAADLLPTIAMTTRLILDAFAGRVPDSCRRTWFGNPKTVATLRGIARDTFTEINTMREFPW